MRALRVVAAACALALLAPAIATAAQLTPTEAVALLRGGGFVLYFRHAATDFGKNDAQMTSFEDCDTQRNLTDSGRDDARAIGAAIRALGIPIGQVRASPIAAPSRPRRSHSVARRRRRPSAAARRNPTARSATRPCASCSRSGRRGA